MPRFIVSECSKNWQHGVPLSNEWRNIGQQFEHVINVNFQRGYKLVTFQHSMSVDHVNGVMVETIIAVFELLQPAAAASSN